MNSKVFQAFRIPSLLLAALLQFMPMVRAALPAIQSASNLFAIIFRWGGAAAAALGTVQAVSGASTLITTTNFLATNGVAVTNKLLTAPQTAGWWSASGLPPGLSLIGSGSSTKIAGTPTTAGVYTFTLIAWSGASAPTSERTTNKFCKYTIVAGGGGGGASNSPPVATAQSVSTAEDTAKAITLAGTDADNNPLTYAIVASPTHGTLAGTAPAVTYTPAANYNGADSFTFRVNDGTTNSAPATVSITVAAVNDAPVAASQSVGTAEDTAKPITLSATDVDGNALTYAVVTSPLHGSLSGTAPNLTYTPAPNFSGADSFTFKANDGTVDSAAVTVSITVTAVNDPPVANSQSVTNAEDTAKAITLTGSDVDGNALTYVIVSAPAHGSLSGTAPNVTYLPATNYDGADSFTFKVNDGIVDSAVATVSLTVTPVNDAPVAGAQSIATDKNVAQAITLTGADVESSPLTFTVVASPTKGVLSGAAPNMTYTPNNNATGADSFTFKVNDGTVDSAVATVSITIAAGPNTAPVADAQSVNATEDTAKAITLSGSDADSNPLAFAIVGAPAHGTLTGTAPNITYTPATNFNGGDSFTFRVNDGFTNSAVATVSISIAAVNDAPVASAQSVSTAEDTAKPITLTGSDVDGDALTYLVVAAPAHGTLSGSAPNLTYTPATNYNGADSFTFKVNDGTVDSVAATVSITVTPVNDAPVASAQSVTTAEETSKAITLSATDVDGNPLTYAVVASPAHGTLSGAAPNLTYKPATNYNGADSFTFKANDGTVDSAPATVSITITAVNDAPVAVAQSIATIKNVATNITLAGTDVEGAALTFVVVTPPVKGTLSGAAPNLTYTPNTNATGADSFTFKVNDGTVDSSAATVSITIASGPNAAPVATAQDITLNEDATMLVTLAGTDADSNPLTYTVVTPPAHGTLTGTAPNLYYRPATNYNGSDSFWFKVNDGVVDSASAVVSLTITPVNDAPVANAQTFATTQDTAKAIMLTGSDVDGDALTFTITTSPAHGTLSGVAPNLIYTPAASYSGSDTIWFKANDGTVDSALAVISLTVNAVVNPPTNNPPTNVPTVAVFAGANAAESGKNGSFLFTRTGGDTKALTVFFELAGTAESGVDYANPGNKVTFNAGKTNATLVIKPVADKIFEGSKTVVLSLVDSTNVDISSQNAASILLGDNDQPRIGITTIKPDVNDSARLARTVAPRPSWSLQTKVHAAAYAGFSLLLQSSTDLTNWTDVAAPGLEQPADYIDLEPTGAPTRFYRTLYVRGEVTEDSIAAALEQQTLSANIVGVVNVQLQPGWNLAANPLDGLPQDGPLGELPEGTRFVPFKSAKVNMYEEGRWHRGVPLTRSTMGGWIYNPSASPVTITYVGELPNPTGKPQLPAGWSVRSSVLDATVGNDQLLGYPLFSGDALYEFNPLGTGADMWITHLLGAEEWDIPPTLTAGQGVLIYKVKSARPNVVAAPVPATPNLIKFTELHQ
jgi:hypothetical protein